MKRTHKEIQTILKNENGVAMLMVITAIVLLTTIMMSFSFDTNVNKLKSYNIEDKGQSRLTAEAGVKFAMARLRLYKEAFNYVEKNPSVKDFAKPELLNSIWNFPFIYPIPQASSMNQIQKDAIKKFGDNTFLAGEMKLLITNISNRINLNMLRVALMETENQNGGNNEGGNNENNEEDDDYAIEAQLVKSLKYSIEKKSETDDYFAGLYMGVEPIELVNILMVNSSDPESLDDDGGAAGMFDEIESKPKLAPLTSWSEVYSLPGWDDDLVELIKNEFTIHGAIMIDLNKMTEKLLRLIIPDINDEEVKEFFEYRDDPDSPKYFNTTDDFKNYVVNVGNIMNKEDFDERIKKFETKGLKFGPSPSLFKIISTGSKGRATYTITAYVVIPAKPYKPKTFPKTEEDKNADGIPDANKVDPTEEDVDGDGIPNNEDPVDNRPADQAKQKTQLLEPRIVEIFVS